LDECGAANSSSPDWERVFGLNVAGGVSRRDV
jgi:hypothetical protein